MAGVQQAAQFFGVGQVGVDFVQEEGGLVLVDEAKEDRSGQVLGAQGARGHGGEKIEGGGLATLRFGGSEVQARGVKKGVESVGVSGPEGEDRGRAGRQDDGAHEAGEDLVQDLCVVDGLGPGFNEGQLDGAGLGVVIGFESAPGDFGVEGFEADAEAGGFGLAGAVVLGGGEGGEAGEGVGVVRQG